MPRHVTATLSPKAALWARRRAAANGSSVSRFIAQMLEREMLRDDAYWAAYRRWKSMEPLSVDGVNWLSREEAHERR